MLVFNHVSAKNILCGLWVYSSLAEVFQCLLMAVVSTVGMRGNCFATLVKSFIIV